MRDMPTFRILIYTFCALFITRLYPSQPKSRGSKCAARIFGCSQMAAQMMPAA